MGDDKSICPCFVTAEQLDAALELCRAECALHRQKAIQMIKNAQRAVSDEAYEETETALDKALMPIRKEIADLKTAHENSEKEHKEFYRNVIYVLFGILGTIAVGFLSLFWSTGGIL